MKSAITCVLIDLSGTVYIDDGPIPGSIEAIKKLHSASIPYKFVTNTTKESLSKMEQKLSAFGLPNELFKGKIHTCVSVCINIIKEKSLRPMLLVDEGLTDDFEGIPQNNPNCVVVGLAPSHFHYSQLNKAFQLLLNKDTHFLALHKSRYYRKSDNQLYLGPGAFVSGLEFASDRKAQVLGKPSSDFFLSAFREWNAHPSTVVMIGDDAKDDVSAAKEIGLQAFLLRTGKYRSGDEEKFVHPPDQTYDNLLAAVNEILFDWEKAFPVS